MLKKRLLSFVAFLSLFTLAACSTATKQTTSESKTTTKILQEPYSDEQFLLGTYVRIRIYDEGKETALKPAFARVKELGDKITINQEGSKSTQ